MNKINLDQETQEKSIKLSAENIKDMSKKLILDGFPYSNNVFRMRKFLKGFNDLFSNKFEKIKIEKTYSNRLLKIYQLEHEGAIARAMSTLNTISIYTRKNEGCFGSLDVWGVLLELKRFLRGINSLFYGVWKK